MWKFLWILVGIAFTACTNNSAGEIADKLQNIQAIAIPGIGKINTISAEGNDLIFATDASARYLNYDVIKNNNSKHMIGDNAVIAIYSLGVGDTVLNSNTNLIFRFQWDNGKRIDVRFSSSELNARAKSIRKKLHR